MACEAEEKKGREGAVGKRSKGMKRAKMKFVPFSFIIASFLAGPESEGEGGECPSLHGTDECSDSPIPPFFWLERHYRSVTQR